MVVSTHPKNMLVKIGSFPENRSKNSKTYPPQNWDIHWKVNFEHGFPFYKVGYAILPRVETLDVLWKPLPQKMSLENVEKYIFFVGNWMASFQGPSWWKFIATDVFQVGS